jgi:hypothetical protein
MNNGGKISLKFLSTLILTLLFFCITVNSSARYYRNHGPASSSAMDTIPNKSDTIPKKNISRIKDTVIVDSAVLDTLPFHSDSVRLQTDTVHIPFSKDSLDGPITYSAQDSVVLDVPTKNITLYNKANTKAGPLTYEEGRDFYQLLGRLSADETMKMAPPVKRDLVQMVVGLKQDIGNAADQVGHAADYYKGLGDYAKAARLGEWYDAAKKYAVPAALGAAGLGAGQKIISLFDNMSR